MWLGDDFGDEDDVKWLLSGESTTKSWVSGGEEEEREEESERSEQPVDMVQQVVVLGMRMGVE